MVRSLDGLSRCLSTDYSPQILFLNKVDIFRTKIMYSSVKSYFPDYDGDDQDFNAARNYFKHRFCRLNRSQTKEIYPSFTNATDTGLLKIVMVRCCQRVAKGKSAG